MSIHRISLGFMLFLMLMSLRVPEWRVFWTKFLAWFFNRVKVTSFQRVSSDSWVLGDKTSYPSVSGLREPQPSGDSKTTRLKDFFTRDQRNLRARFQRLPDPMEEASAMWKMICKGQNVGVLYGEVDFFQVIILLWIWDNPWKLGWVPFWNGILLSVQPFLWRTDEVWISTCGFLM